MAHAAKPTTMTAMYGISALVLISCVNLAASHGLMLIPASRNYQSYKNDPYELKNYKANELTGGGVAFISRGRTLTWPQGRHSLCGDPWNMARPHKHMVPRPVQARYTVGETINIHVLLTTNHLGRFEFRVCPRNATAERHCTRLERADGQGPWWYVPEGKCCDSWARPTVPATSDNFYQWYFFMEPGNDYSGTPTFVLRYKLPARFACERCILQWYWLTGNTCNPGPCNPADPYFPNCDRQNMDYCGNRQSSYPEEFWNCADIQIRRPGMTG